MGNTLELYDCSSYTSSSLLLQPQLCMALNSMVVARSGYETLAVKPGISTPVMPFIWFTWFNSYGKLALSQVIVTFYIKDARLLRRPESCMLRNNEWTYQVKMFDGLRPAAPESSFFFYQWASLGTFAYFASPRHRLFCCSLLFLFCPWWMGISYMKCECNKPFMEARKETKNFANRNSSSPPFSLWEFRSLLSKVERVHYQFCINDQKVCEQLVKYLPKSRARDLVHNFQSWNIIGHFSWKHHVTVCFSCKWRFLAGIYISTLLSSRIASWVIFQNVFWVARMKIAANKLACLRLPIHIVLSVL